ncbi:MAG: ribosome assembly RNA-binding protein YhbY [Clostridia bacterium]|nr:ribosome assembly RNA-binding protein YhbY [Clostridia bacterium]
MLKSNQRAFLRAQANRLDPILHVGKGGLSDTVVRQADDALTAHELIKGRVLETAPQSAREIAEALAPAVAAEVVFTIGRTFVLYRKNLKEPVIVLPR